MRSFPLVVILIFLAHLDPAQSAWWGVFSGQTPSEQSDDDLDQLHEPLPLMDYSTPFEMDTAAVPGSERGGKLLDDLKKKLQSSCWHHAYSSLFSSCREVLKNDDKKMRLAFKFADCFLRSSGKDPLKPCPDNVPIKECTKSLTDHRHHLLLQFFIDVASMCHHLQSEAFKVETEDVIFNLKNSAHWVEGRLTSMQNQAKVILDNTDRIFGLQQRLQEEYVAMEETIAEMHEGLHKGILHLKEHADETHRQLHDVSFFQKEIADQQEKMAHQQQLLSESLQEEVLNLKAKADDINNNMIKSLTGQEELLIGQDAALSSLTNLKKLQQDALEESRSSFEGFTNEARENQMEFHKWQEQLQEVHHRLAEGSASILNAQEVFASKQALLFTSLERLFSLHNAILTESRTVKAFLFYAPVAILIYLITGTRQTSNARAVLYFGLSVSFGAEFWLIRYEKFSSFFQHEALSNTLWIRGTFAVMALSYVLYCIFTFRDYATLSYSILLDMQKKLEENTTFLGSLYIRAPTYRGYEMETQEFNSPMSSIPCFQGYEDSAGRKDALSDDPDYDPVEDSDYEKLQDTVPSRHNYNLRQNARRKHRPLARTASMLDWETEEMFTNLFSSVAPR